MTVAGIWDTEPAVNGLGRDGDAGLAHMGGWDPGVAQELAIGAIGRMSMLDVEPAEPNTGLHGTYTDLHRGDSRSPQSLGGTNWDPELHRDLPPVQTSTPYFPGRPTTVTGEIGEDQD